MRHRLSTLVCLVVLAANVVACGDDVDTVAVEAADDGSTIELTMDQRLEVTLYANTGSTGYEWQVEDSGILELSSEDVEGRGRDPGDGEIDTFTFRPTGPGAGTLRMVLVQPWAQEPPEDEFVDHTFELTITVTG